MSWFCDDPTITFLKSIGYSVVRLPRPDLRPLQILADYGRELTNIGDLATIMKPGPGAGLPPVGPDQTGPVIAGDKSSTLSVGVGLSILGSVIGAMGGGNLGLDVAYKSAAKVTFEFSETLTNDVQIAAVDKFLGQSDVDPGARGVMNLLDADDVYVVTRTIKSTKITVSSQTSSGTDASVDIPEIQQIVGGKVSVKSATAASTKITYEGQVPLIFGFQAIRLFYYNGRYTSFEPLDPGWKASKDLVPAGLPAGVEAFSRPAPMVRVTNL